MIDKDGSLHVGLDVTHRVVAPGNKTTAAVNEFTECDDTTQIAPGEASVSTALLYLCMLET